MRRRAHREYVEDDSLVVTIPPIVQKSTFWFPSLPDRCSPALRPSPVDAKVERLDDFAQLGLLARIRAEIHARGERACDQQCGVDHRQFAAPNAGTRVQIEKVVVEAFVTGRLRAAALIAVAEETQYAKTAV